MPSTLCLYMHGWQSSLVKLCCLFICVTGVVILVVRLCVRAMEWPEGSKHEFLSSFDLKGFQTSADLMVQLTALNPNLCLFLFTVGFIYVQTFAIPGTCFFNLTGAALFSLSLGFPLCLLYNTIGSCLLYLISRYLGGDLVDRFLSSRIEKFRTLLAEKQQTDKWSLFFYMVSVRVFPFTPHWVVNVSSAQLNIPLPLFAASIFIGLAPYNFLACQAGLILKELNSTRDIMNTKVTSILIAIACLLFIVPTLYSKCRSSQRPKKLTEGKST